MLQRENTSNYLSKKVNIIHSWEEIQESNYYETAGSGILGIEKFSRFPAYRFRYYDPNIYLYLIKV